ncbi:MAG: hypothetical protein AAF213_08075 [Pseudomonadota bacterium]
MVHEPMKKVDFPVTTHENVTGKKKKRSTEALNAAKRPKLQPQRRSGRLMLKEAILASVELQKALK